MIEYFLLSGFYLLSAWLVLAQSYAAYRNDGFSLHLAFSLIYFVTFYLGFPLSAALAAGFGTSLPSMESITLTLFVSLIGYLIYFGVYLLARRESDFAQAVEKRKNFANFEAKTTACLLGTIACGSLGTFIFLNGLLLFELESYSRIFSETISGTALKRFFYFFIPALLILFFLREDKKAWRSFLAWGVVFGTLSYFAVGGTRANLAIVFALFFFLGVYKGYLSFRWLTAAGVAMVVVMFALALFRYGLNVSGFDALYTFLYLTRDTFSPWENVALIIGSNSEYKGLMPFVRDFYVYIPQSLWPGRPDLALNTANYFTREILNNFSGLAMSPTLLGSFYIMGGFPMIGLGMAFTGLLIGNFDNFFQYGKNYANSNGAALIQAYCFANLFNLIILIREGADAFFSRFLFFSAVFAFCWCVARAVGFMIKNMSKEKTVWKK